MIPQLSLDSKFKETLLYPYNQTSVKNRIFNFQFGDKLLLVSTLCWLLHILYRFQLLVIRPVSIYNPRNFFSFIFIPEFPSPLLFYVAFFISFFCVIVCFIYKQNIIIRSIMSFTLMWLSAVQWGYGHFSHVDYIFILAHVLSVFLPRKISDNVDVNIYSRGIAYYRAGILFTYFMAGFWKLTALAYKLISQSDDINWLHPKAVLINAIASLRGLDQAFGPLFIIFDIPYLWAVLFVIIIICQFLVVIGAFVDKAHLYVIFFSVLFHFFNAIAFHTIFVWQPLVILILFFPYHSLFDKAK